MASYPGTPYTSGPLPGPPPGPPPAPSRQSSNQSVHSNQPSYGTPSPYEQPTQQFPSLQRATSQSQQQQHLPTIPQQRPISQSELRPHATSNPQYPSYQMTGSYPPPGHYAGSQGQFQSAPMQYGSSAPNTPGFHGYPFGEMPYYPNTARPGMDPRRTSQSSHRSNASWGSRQSRRSLSHSGEAPNGFSRYNDGSEHSGEEEMFDSAWDSDEERRHQRKKERHRKRKEEEEKKRNGRRDRPTLGDTVFSLFGELKSAMGSDSRKY